MSKMIIREKFELPKIVGDNGDTVWRWSQNRFTAILNFLYEQIKWDDEDPMFIEASSDMIAVLACMQNAGGEQFIQKIDKWTYIGHFNMKENILIKRKELPEKFVMLLRKYGIDRLIVELDFSGELKEVG